MTRFDVFLRRLFYERRRRAKHQTTRLHVELLESRLAPAVTGAFDSATGVFSIAGDAAANRIDVEISSSYVTAWNNGSYVQGVSQVSRGLVKQLNIGAKDNNDAVNFVQKVEWSTGNVFIYGDSHNDTLNVDCRTEGAAKVTVFGGAGVDTVNVLNWLPTPLTTPDENPVLRPLAKAQQELRNATLHPEMKQFDDTVVLTANMIRSYQGSRSADLYRKAIDQYDVKYSFTNRYGAKNGLTFCNYFTHDVISSMSLYFPQFPYTDSNGKLRTKPQSANQMHDWLTAAKNGGAQAGWIEARKTSASELQNLLSAVRAGKPAVAVYKNTSGPGHIAIIVPDQLPTFVFSTSTLNDLLIAQAGAVNFSKGKLSDGFRTTDARNNVRFFYHQ